MRGADLEPSHTLLEHLRRRIAALAVELGTADDDGRLWGWGADLAADVDVLDVLLERERFAR